MLLTLRFCLALPNRLLRAQHSRANSKSQKHRNRHDDFLRVVFLDSLLEFIDFLYEFLLAQAAYEVLERGLGGILLG